jgi:hypothetical protein
MKQRAMDFNLGNEWRACMAIAGQARQHSVNDGFNAFLYLMLLLALVMSLTMWLGWKSVTLVLGAGVAFPLATLSLVWWCYLVDSLGRQNSPIGHFLVPRMGGRSLAVLIVNALLILAVNLLVLTMADVAPSISVAATAVILGAVVIIEIVSAAVYLVLALLICGVFFPTVLPGDLRQWLLLHHLVASVLTCLFYALIGILFWRPRSNPARPRWTVMQNLGKLRRYEWHLQRDCARGDAVRLMLYAASPRAHVSLAALPILIVLLLGTWALYSFDRGSTEWSTAPTTTFPAVLYFVWVQYYINVLLVRDMLARRSEQALFILTAKAPPAPVFNALLGRGLLRQFVLLWALLSVGAMLGLVATGVRDVRLIAIGALFVLNLLAAAPLLRDYAGGVGPKGLIAGAICYSAFFLVAKIVLKLGDKLPVFAAIALLLAASLFAYAVLLGRWRRMQRGPVAFPAGRMA